MSFKKKKSKKSLHLCLCKSASRRTLSLPRGTSELFRSGCLLNSFSLFEVHVAGGRAEAGSCEHFLSLDVALLLQKTLT